MSSRFMRYRRVGAELPHLTDHTHWFRAALQDNMLELSHLQRDILMERQPLTFRAFDRPR